VNRTPKKPTPKITVAMTPEMLRDLEEERKARRIATIPEVVRIICSEYLKAKGA
jgi:Arc/MetJ-type ribon-helix-helix transcriptional regulator